MDIENVEKDRMKFYAESGLIGEGGFLKDYFNVKKGVRCIAGHYVDYPDKQPRYYEYDNRGMCRMMTLPDRDGKWNGLVDYNTVHSFMFAFDDRVLDWMNMHNYEHNDIIEENIVGLNAVIEIDAPYEGTWEGASRLNFFDYVDEFNEAIRFIGRRLEELGEDYNIIFSGNGIYIVLGGVYIDIDCSLEEFEKYHENFINLFESLRSEDGLGDDLKVHVDNAAAPWNDYFKIPWTFHPNGNISLPLGKGEIDGEWLRRVCNGENVMKNARIVDEIIRCAVAGGWKKLW